jgi:hypothetical protein
LIGLQSAYLFNIVPGGDKFIMRCGRPAVITMVGMGFLEQVAFCEPCAESYVTYCQDLYEQETSPFNRDTMYCKWKAAERALAAYREGKSEQFQKRMEEGQEFLYRLITTCL